MNHMCYKPNYINYKSDDGTVYTLNVMEHYDAITLVMIEPSNLLLFCLEHLDPRPVRWWIFDFKNHKEDLIQWINGEVCLKELMLTKIPSFIGEWTWDDKIGNLIVRKTGIYIPELLTNDYYNTCSADLEDWDLEYII